MLTSICHVLYAVRVNISYLALRSSWNKQILIQVLLKLERDIYFCLGKNHFYLFENFGRKLLKNYLQNSKLISGEGEHAIVKSKS